MGVKFDEHTIAQVITVLRAKARATGNIPVLVKIVEGQEAERLAWRQLALRHLTAIAEGATMRQASQSGE